VTLLASGWFDFAMRAPGLPQNSYPWNNSMENFYLHSMVGLYATTRSPVWTGTVLYDGTAMQHFPQWQGVPHGGTLANPFGPGWEAEGGFLVEDGGLGYDEPLRPAQVATYLRLIADHSAYTGNQLTRVPGSRRGLVEHREVASTACPSGRYAPLYIALQEDSDMAMSAAERVLFNKMLAHLGGETRLNEYGPISEYLDAVNDTVLVRGDQLDDLESRYDLHGHPAVTGGPIKAV
jgi:hypothetical protein